MSHRLAPDTPASDHFVDVTEAAGQRISREQLERTCHRYHWARGYCGDRDVLELACGAGQGLGLLAGVGRSVRASDISPELLALARATYGTQIALDAYSADDIPLPDGSVDVVLLFEALYYLPNAAGFAAEAYRVLRPGGSLLIVTANRDLYDFTPSPFSTRYLGAVELTALLRDAGFTADLAGYVDVTRISLRQKLFRPVKYLAGRFNLIPGTMGGKSVLKRIVFGEMTEMPARLDDVSFEYVAPEPIPGDRPCRQYKVLYCAARKA